MQTQKCYFWIIHGFWSIYTSTLSNDSVEASNYVIIVKYLLKFPNNLSPTNTKAWHQEKREKNKHCWKLDDGYTDLFLVFTLFSVHLNMSFINK